MNAEKTYQLLFVCTGNVCRSPMAEYLMRQKLGKTSNWQITSAGLFTANGQPASTMAIQAMDEVGIDIRKHRSRQITAEIINQSNMIVVMTKAHLMELLSRFPDAQDRAYVLGSFLAKPSDIIDPIGGNIEIYRQTRDLIVNSLNNLEKYIAKCSAVDI